MGKAEGLQSAVPVVLTEEMAGGRSDDAAGRENAKTDSL